MLQDQLAVSKILMVNGTIAPAQDGKERTETVDPARGECLLGTYLLTELHTLSNHSLNYWHFKSELC